MQKFLFDKEIVNNQLSVLNNTLSSQRQAKKTLLSHLEKFSNAMYDNFNSESTDSLLALINEAHFVFESIKSNINKTLELKKFLENISQSAFLNTIDSEKFDTEFKLLLENISKTNSNYLSFMNNYEKFITPNSKNTISETSIDTSENNIEELSTNDVVENISDIEPSIFDNVENNVEELSTNDVVENISDIEPSIFDNVENNVEEISTDDVVENISDIEPSIFDNVKNDVEEISGDDVVENISDTEPSIFDNIENDVEEISGDDVVENISDTEPSIFDNIENNIEEISGDDAVENVSKAESSNEDIDFSTYLQEKVLIINKKSGVAILPYSISDLDELFLDNPEKYSSIQDIIDKEYTVSLDDYENTSISRYKEAFKLAKDKSNYSFSQAANFAKGLLIENKVSTLIIAACKNIEELENYIECANNNQLEKFNHFKIIEK